MMGMLNNLFVKNQYSEANSLYDYLKELEEYQTYFKAFKYFGTVYMTAESQLIDLGILIKKIDKYINAHNVNAQMLNDDAIYISYDTFDIVNRLVYYTEFALSDKKKISKVNVIYKIPDISLLDMLIRRTKMLFQPMNTVEYKCSYEKERNSGNIISLPAIAGK